jgi:CubicO group peptidase (beta-lactamase class C family)
MVSRIASVVDKHVRAGDCKGAGIAVMQRGKMVAEHYAGEAAPGLPSGPNVIWPLASISKVYAATVVTRLIEDGLLTLNTPVRELIPEFSGGGREEVHVRHLLTHTAGMIYESPEMENRLKAHAPMSALIQEAIKAPLLFKPGTSLSYADNHYLLAGHLAEIVTGKTFSELVRTLVLEPARLRETFIPLRREDENRAARVAGVMAEDSDGAMYNSRYSRELSHPAFGVFSTVTDLARFGLLFAPGGPRILSAAGIRLMTTNQTGCVPGQPPLLRGFSADARMPWAVGFALQTEQVPAVYCDLASFRTFAHGGATGCVLVIDPECDLVVGLVSNAHASLGRDRWYMRLQSILNCVFAEFTSEVGSLA